MAAVAPHDPSASGGGGGDGGWSGGGGGGGGKLGGIEGGGGEGAMSCTITIVGRVKDATCTPSAAERVAGVNELITASAAVMAVGFAGAILEITSICWLVACSERLVCASTAFAWSATTSRVVEVLASAAASNGDVKGEAARARRTPAALTCRVISSGETPENWAARAAMYAGRLKLSTVPETVAEKVRTGM